MTSKWRNGKPGTIEWFDGESVSTRAKICIPKRGTKRGTHTLRLPPTVFYDGMLAHTLLVCFQLNTGKRMAGRQGFEPRYADPESAVLPLDDLPVTQLILITSSCSGRRLSSRPPRDPNPSIAHGQAGRNRKVRIGKELVGRGLSAEEILARGAQSAPLR